ncbi:ribonuclease R family protein [Lyngbya confervoides]|uniref:Ribonuclease R n=1 Tax=Lyngbya confervoides BDU141951 TaxID=1574623 RepID=A0ABD4T0K7_9CYAN|nr:ribonuclease R family protein [Lyngbya confervoides]MCM1982109.1 ribonuclease R [Lyngbya confervoides BDU141951]
MEFSISSLLDSFGEDKLIAPKLLEKKLECDDEQKLQHLQITLDALEKVGILAKERGKYRRVNEEGVVEGKLRCSSKGFCFAIQDGEGTEDIYIRESQLNSAWNGDRVLVKVTKEGRRRRSPEGEVRLILERANPSVLAHVRTDEAGEPKAIPLDDRLLFELALTEDNNSAKVQEAIDQLVHVEILRYPLGPKAPIGRISQILGSDAQSAPDTELVFCKYDLPRSFSDAVLEAAESLPKKLRKADQKKRELLQKLPTITLENNQQAPYGLDHAFSISKNKQGQWDLGIHIVDFTPFVPLNSTLDQEARARAACITLSDKLVPLFPEALMERVGSLPEKSERLAFTLKVLCDEAGGVQSFELLPSVIQVDCNIDEAQASAILNPKSKDSPKKDLKALAPYHEMLEQLGELTALLRQQRYERGSFDLWSSSADPDLFGDTGLSGTFTEPATLPARAVVAELLLLANQLVLEHMHRLGVPAIYQHQAAPDAAALQDIIKLSENLGFTCNLNPNATVQPNHFQELTAQFREANHASMLFDLLGQTLEPTVLSSAPGPHFAQAIAQHYGQFVAPSHRYSDFINHHILHAIFNKGRDRRNSQAKEGVHLGHSTSPETINWNVLPPSIRRDLETAIEDSLPRLNERLQLILQAEKDLQGLQKTKTMQGHIGQVFQGVITGIQSYGFFVRLEVLSVEGLVHVSSLKDDWYEYRSRQQTLIGRKNRRQYRLGDSVEVEVKSVDYYRQQIDLAVVGGGSELTEDDLGDEADLSPEAVDDPLDLEEDLVDDLDDLDEDLEDDLEDEFEDELDESFEDDEFEDDEFEDDEFDMLGEYLDDMDDDQLDADEFEDEED